MSDVYEKPNSSEDSAAEIDPKEISLEIFDAVRAGDIERNDFDEILEEKFSQRIISISASQSQSFSGPLPPPNIIGGYENRIPGSGERIIAMAEKEQKHRHGIHEKEASLAKKELDTSADLTKRGQIIGAILLLVFGIAAFYFFDKENNTAGGIILGVTVIAAIARFIPDLRKTQSQ